jgi:microcin C transport system permease protein
LFELGNVLEDLIVRDLQLAGYEVWAQQLECRVSFGDVILTGHIDGRIKGLSESKVMYGHVFRNAMLIVISGFPALFIGVFFGGSLIIETLFSLDGLGRLGFEATIARDYPVMFGTLFAFSLMGLVIGILTDITYVLIDPRIDFERRA